MALPPPKPSQRYVDVSVLETSNIAIPENFLFKGGSHTKLATAPTLSFLIVHPQSGKKIVFDLGLRKDWETAHPPAIVQLLRMTQANITVDAIESLHRGGLSPEDVDTVVYSHVHFEHVGDPALFPRARFIVGHGAKDLLAAGYSPDDAEPANHSHFIKHLLPNSRTSYLSTETWEPLGPFPRTHDLLGDGSVYLVDAPGHLAGHLSILVRTSADGGWIYLAGDTAHDVRILSGELEFGTYPDFETGIEKCVHQDPEAAQNHLERVRQLRSTHPRVLVLLSHDKGWFEDNRDKALFPGKITSP